jgi:hypothetical protein
LNRDDVATRGGRGKQARETSKRQLVVEQQQGSGVMRHRHQHSDHPVPNRQGMLTMTMITMTGMTMKKICPLVSTGTD